MAGSQGDVSDEQNQQYDIRESHREVHHLKTYKASQASHASVGERSTISQRKGCAHVAGDPGFWSGGLSEVLIPSRAQNLLKIGGFPSNLPENCMI